MLKWVEMIKRDMLAMVSVVRGTFDSLVDAESDLSTEENKAAAEGKEGTDGEGEEGEKADGAAEGEKGDGEKKEGD